MCGRVLGVFRSVVGSMRRDVSAADSNFTGVAYCVDAVYQQPIHTLPSRWSASKSARPAPAEGARPLAPIGAPALRSKGRERNDRHPAGTQALRWGDNREAAITRLCAVYLASAVTRRPPQHVLGGNRRAIGAWPGGRESGWLWRGTSRRWRAAWRYARRISGAGR